MKCIQLSPQKMLCICVICIKYKIWKFNIFRFNYEKTISPAFWMNYEIQSCISVCDVWEKSQTSLFRSRHFLWRRSKTTFHATYRPNNVIAGRPALIRQFRRSGVCFCSRLRCHTRCTRCCSSACAFGSRARRWWRWQGERREKRRVDK